MPDFDVALVDGRRRPDERHRWTPSPRRLARTRQVVFTLADWTCQGCGLAFHHDRTDEVLDGRRAPVVLVERPGDFPGVIYLELDHVVPYRDGGPFKVANLRALCSPCNAGRPAEVLPTIQPGRR